MPIPAIVGGLISLAPSLIDLFAGDDDKNDSALGRVVDQAVSVAQELTGTGDPKSAEDALRKNPELLAQYLTKCEEIRFDYFKEETERIKAVNRTMRVEAKSEDPWTRRWRPFWGFSSAVAFLFVCALCCWLAFNAVSGKDPNALKMIPEVVSAFAMLFGIPGAILGVASWHRGKKQRIEAGEQPSKLDRLYERFFGDKGE